MAKSVEAYVDDKGHVYSTPSEAIVADIAAVLGRVGEEGGLTKGVAALILEKRAAIEKAFNDYDRLLENMPEHLEEEDEATIHRLKAR